jgi:O-antigen ligase
MAALCVEALDRDAGSFAYGGHRREPIPRRTHPLIEVNPTVTDRATISMPLVALLLCTTFVLGLLFVEKRESRGVSLALWIPTMWVIIAASRPLGTWSTSTQQIGTTAYANNETGSALDRYTLVALAVVGLVILVRRKRNWSSLLRRHIWLLVLLGYMLVSTFWSEITLIALKRWSREWIAVVMALVMSSEADPLQAFASVLRRTAYALIPFSVVLIKYYPVYGRRYGKYSGAEMWTGVTGQKNELGRLCMITVFFLLTALWRRGNRTGSRKYQTWADLCVALIGIYLLIGSSSATSLATLVLGGAGFMSLQWLRKFKLKLPQAALLALVLFLMAYGTSVPFLGGSNVATFSSALGRDDTLTGRTEVWAVVLPARMQQPLLGYGFSSFWTDARRQLYDIPTAHNGYLDVLLELGEVGLGLYAVWLIACARQLHRLLIQDYQWASFGICLLLMGLVYNSTESALNSLTDYMTALVVFAVFVLPSKARSHARRAQLGHSLHSTTLGSDFDEGIPPNATYATAPQ